MAKCVCKLLRCQYETYGDCYAPRGEYDMCVDYKTKSTLDKMRVSMWRKEEDDQRNNSKA